MKDPNWLRRQQKTAREEVARMPEWELWGAEDGAKAICRAIGG